ncbi:MAG: protease modulator HflC [Chromatiales bacterium]|jgi:modulator of FtsH protease HflC|nr:protease modulator HflC [Chromatiales bacterium]
MNALKLVVIVVLLFVAVVAPMSLFTVHQTEVAILRQLGEIKRSDFEPGIHVKMPIFQNVLKFDSRIQSLDSEPELYLTSEKKNVNVDSFVKWRIKNVADFFTSTGGDPAAANSRLAEVLRKRLKDEFGTRTIVDVISGDRVQIMEVVTKTMNEYGASLGVEIVDVRIKRIDLPATVSNSVFRRMQAERQEVAKQYRSRGEKEATTIRARAERERTVMYAEARRDGERTRGEGDALAADIYAQAYSQDSEFYGLYRSLNAYRTSFGSNNDILLMKPDSEFFRYFKDPMGGRDL